MAAMIRTVAMLGAVVLAGGCAGMRSPPSEGASGDPLPNPAAMAYAARGMLARELDGDPGSAAMFFEKAARAEPTHLGLTLLAGVTLLELDESQRLADLARTTLAHHPASSQAHYDFARLLWNSGDPQTAGDLFLKAARLDPANPQPILGLAYLALHAGERDLAVDRFKAAQKLAPEDPMPYIGLAMSALETSDHELALEIAANAVVHGIADAALVNFFREFALLLIARELYAEALSCLQALRTLAPEALAPHQLTALTYARLERHARAREALLQWPGAAADPAVTADLLADIYEEGDDRELALQTALDAVAEAGAPLRAWLRAGRLLILDDQPHQAAMLMQQAAGPYPGNETVWLLRGLAYSALESYPQAVESLEQAAALAERNRRTLPPMFDFWIGAAYERTGRYEDAEKHFRRSMELHPGIHEAHNYLAYMWAERNVNLDEALELVKTALSGDPDNGAYIDTLGWIYFQQGRPAEALAELKRALEFDPDHPVINDHVGDALQALNRESEAITHWKKSFRKDNTMTAVAEKLRRAGIDPETLKACEDPTD